MYIFISVIHLKSLHMYMASPKIYSQINNMLQKISNTSLKKSFRNLSALSSVKKSFLLN